MKTTSSNDGVRVPRSWTPMALGLGVLSLGVALAHAFAPGFPGLSLAGAVLLFGGAGLSILCRATPAEPSPWKLLTLGLLLSPFLVAGPYFLLRTRFGAPASLAGAFGFVALIQLPGIGTRVAFHRTGRATRAALGGVLLLTLFTAWIHGGEGNALRLGDGGVERAALALAVDRTVPPENPFLAGESWERPWAHAGLTALVGRVLALAPSRAEVGLAMWATLGLGLSFVFLVAALWRSGPATAAAPWALGIGVGIPTVLAGVLGAGDGFGGQSASTLAEGLLAAHGGGPELPQVPLSILLRPGPDGVALALLGGAILAAAHGLRHGVRPWPALAGLLLGLAEWIRPGCAWVPGGTVALMAIALPGRPIARPRMLLAVALGMGAPLLLERWSGWSETLAGALRFGDPGLGPGSWVGVALGIAPLAVSLVLLGRAQGQDRAREFRGVHGLALALVGLGLWLRMGPVRGLELPDQGGGFRPLDGGVVGVGGALGLVGWTALPGLLRARAGEDGVESRTSGAGRPRALGRLPSVALAGAVILLGFAGFARHRELWVEPGWRQAQWPLVELPMAYAVAEVEGESEETRDLREALDFLRDGFEARDERPVLLVNPEPQNPGATRTAAGFHLGGLCSGLDLWTTESEGLAPGELRGARSSGLRSLYRATDGTDITFLRELQRMGRPAVALVTRDDRSDRSWLENKFGPLGFRMLRLFGSVSVYVTPGALAETVDPALRPFPVEHFPRGGEPVLGREEKR